MTEPTTAGESTSPSAPRARWFRRHPKTALLLFVSLLLFGLDWLLGLALIPGVFRCPHPVYHHGLLPSRSERTTWGEKHANPYRMTTNSLGFRDRTQRQVPLQPAGKRLLILGDSFAEGIGVDYEQTFVGLVEAALAGRFDVLNASVVSYSPKLYYLKTKHLLEEVGLKFDHLLVFIDISDITNELAYEAFEPQPFGAVAGLRHGLTSYFEQNSFLGYLISQMTKPKDQVEYDADGLFPCLAKMDPRLLRDPDYSRATHMWTVDRGLYQRFGLPGMKLALHNMRRLARLCSRANIGMTVAVYPWPQQIVSKDLDSVQVRAWREFAKANKTGFIDIFPRFIDGTPYEEIERKYFLKGDVHWNPAGHRVVADAVLEHFR